MLPAIFGLLICLRFQILADLPNSLVFDLVGVISCSCLCLKSASKSDNWRQKRQFGNYVT